MNTIFSIITTLTLGVPNGNDSLNSRSYSVRASSIPFNQDNDVNAIREEYKRINGLDLKTETYTYTNEDCVEDGEIIYYLNRNDIVKVVEKGNFKDGSWVTEYYYKNSKFIFGYESVTGGAAAGPEVTTKFRYYIKNDKAIRQMEGDTIVKADSKFSEALSKAYILLKMNKTKNFSEVFCN